MSRQTRLHMAHQERGEKTLSREEFAAQFRRSFRVLWLIAAGVLGDRSMAEDVVQDAALIGLDKLDTFEAGSNFTAWMGQMVRHVALNRARKERRRRPAPFEAADLQTTPTSPDLAGDHDLVDLKGRMPDAHQHFDDRVLRALNGLGETARACLLLRTVGGMDYAEISKLLEIPEGTAMSHVHRTRMLLRERLADHWRGPTVRGNANES